MTVIDASAMVEALIGRDPDERLLVALQGEIAAPHLLDVEVMSALRGLCLAKKLTDARAVEARRDYFELSISRTESEPLADRVWQLRRQFTTYDASNLALAEALEADLISCDRKLDTRGHRANVTVLPRSV